MVYGLQVNAACASQAYVVPGLLEGQDYLFRVRAENRLGFGPFTMTTDPAHARDPICEDKFMQIPEISTPHRYIEITFLMFPPQTHLTPPQS